MAKKSDHLFKSVILLILLTTLSEAIIDSLVRADETDPFALINKGSGLFDLGMYNESYRAYEQAIKINPNNTNAWVAIGKVLITIGRYTKSLEAYNRALKLDNRKADAWYGKGNALLLLGMNKEAIGCYDEALSQRPGYAEAYENRKLAWNATSLTHPIEASPDVLIKIETTPAGAEVWMDGEYQGNGSTYGSAFEKPFDKTENHIFTLKKNGLESKINVITSKPQNLTVNLYTNNTTTHPS